MDEGSSGGSGCRILVISSSNEDALFFLEKISKNTSSIDENIVPWTITNKYYSADVHFQLHQFSDHDDTPFGQDAPAVIFLWSDGEPYRKHLENLSQRLSVHDFEVSLAVRLNRNKSPSKPATHPEVHPNQSELPVDAMTEEDNIDEYVSSHGFEFVDVHEDDDAANLPYSRSDDFPGLSRIIDALSTIKWPSMVKSSKKVGRASSKMLGTDFLGDEELSSLIAATQDDEHDIWARAASESQTPHAGDLGHHDGFGFDDNFTVFVSASPVVPSQMLASAASSSSFGSNSTIDIPVDHKFLQDLHSPTEQEDSLLTPSDSGITYKSLGSVSDFGDMEEIEHDQHHDHIFENILDDAMDSDEDGLPTKEEIHATSQRIFGSLSMSDSSLDDSAQFVNVPPPDGSDLRTPMGQNPLDLESQSFGFEKILRTLQGIKEEISLMPEAERRRAAARVALGFAYGLDDDA